MLVWNFVSLFIRFITVSLHPVVKNDRFNYLNVRLKS